MQGWIQPGWASLKAHVRPLDRVALATGSAVLVHAAGLWGILFLDRATFIAMTPVNLLLMQVLAWWTCRTSKLDHAKAYAFLYIVGILVEWIGVRTGLLFGSYSYGDLLGPKVEEVPLLIGGNWFIVLSGSLALVIRIRSMVSQWSGDQGFLRGLFSHRVVISAVAALAATAFDRIMEPAAVRLGFWHWSQGYVPVFNYISWFVVSFLALWWGGDTLHAGASTFTSRLLLVQATFFLLIGLSH